jgi:hypothetical protein
MVCRLVTALACCCLASCKEAGSIDIADGEAVFGSLSDCLAGAKGENPIRTLAPGRLSFRDLHYGKDRLCVELSGSEFMVFHSPMRVERR